MGLGNALGWCIITDDNYDVDEDEEDTDGDS